jgi:glycine/D-amino acid oxidase-like deaminating enzyme
MTRSTADVVVCGAGIGGIAAAYHLAVRHSVGRVVIVDDREPLTLTSDKGTQGYRNWWPGPDATMHRFVSHSIDLLEESAAESGNAFRLNRRGYVFATARDSEAGRIAGVASQVSSFGMGAVRRHDTISDYQPAPAEGFADQPDGADLLLGDAACAAFPFLARDTVAALHIRRAGWLNAMALGDWFLSRAIANGAVFVRDRVSGIHTEGGRVREVRLASGDVVGTERVILAAGPELPEMGRMIGVDFPVVHELHGKVTIRDPRGAVRRDAPFVIGLDPVLLEWADAERPELDRDAHTRRLLQPLPAGVHVRPVDLEFGDELYLIWTYETDVRPFVWPPAFSRHYGDVVLRGCAQMIPGLADYVSGGSTGVVDGGYYCKTRENRPLIGPLPVEGAFVLGALSGSGVMASHAAGDLVARHVADQPLPEYAKSFLPSRYDDPAYRKLVDQWGPLVGQL